MSTADKVLCVTGGTGYIASWLVKSLLQRGSTVKATVCNPDDPKKMQNLRALEGAKGRLHLCKADLQEEGSFDSAVNGCEAVFHTASSVLFSASDSQHWFMLSKTLAEKATWDFTKENGIDRVVINLGIVIGPLLQPPVNLSTKKLKTFPDRRFEFVDARDIAHVHILALENPSASGRYCLGGETIHYHYVLKLLCKLYPALHLPHGCEDDRPIVSAHRVSTDKVEDLGTTFIPLEGSLRDTVESLVEKGFPSV